MSAHRLHYCDLNPADPAQLEPAEQRGAPEPEDGLTPAVMLLVILVLLALTGVVHLVQQALRPATIVTPVRAGFVQAFELPPLQAIEDARIEGFRAGMATAAENGCTVPALTSPIPR